MRKLLSTLLAVTMLLTLVPSTVLADEFDGQAEDMEAAETSVEETVAEEQVPVDPELLELLPGNDELFSAYVDLTLAGMDTEEASPFGVNDPAYNRLGEKEKAIYDVLKSLIKGVAQNGGSTVFDITSCFPKTEWTSEDIGNEDLIIKDSNGENVFNPKLEAAIANEFDYDLSSLVNALLMDCPYELYWFDKTTKYTASGYYMSGSSTQVTITNEDKTPLRRTITFVVAQSYQGTGSTQVRNDVAKVGTAETTAQQIVAVNAGKSDYDRLLAYKDAICERVSYNYDAVNTNAAYGDPWQLIDVFAGGTDAQVVCEGYSKAFQYLCDLTKFQGNVESYIATGYMASTGGSATGAGAHMWNIVRIDNASYLVDVTNCDGSSIGAPAGLFLAGDTGADSNYKFSFEDSAGNKTEKNASFSVKVQDSVIVHYLYDFTEELPWESSILTLADENYTPPKQEEVAGIVICRGSTEFTDGAEDVIAAGDSVTYTAKVIGENNSILTGHAVTWVVNDESRGVSVDNSGKVTVADTATVGTSVDLSATVNKNAAGEVCTARLTITVGEKPPVITPIQDSWVTISDEVYTGKEVKPKITVKDGTTGTLLAPTVHYNVSFSDNIYAGTATAIITGINSYGGEARKTFTIKPAEITSIGITVPSKTIFADDTSNTSIESLKTLLALPDITNVTFGEGNSTSLNVTWQDPANAFNKKGGTYTFRGTVQTGTNFKEYQVLEATITVKPVTVQSVTSPSAVTVKATELDKLMIPATVAVTYDRESVNGTVNITWDRTLNDLQKAANDLGNSGSTTVTLTATAVGYPDWATVPASIQMPKYAVTITTKDEANVSITNATSVGGTYGGTYTAPNVTVSTGTETADASECVYSYSGTTLDGASYGPSKEVPPKAGSYTVVVTYEDDNYFGRASTEFSIRPKQITLAWSGYEGLTYSGAPVAVKATVNETELISGDTVNVTVTGGNEVNAGSYSATAVLSSKNYSATNESLSYSIAKGVRGLSLALDAVNLYPHTGLSKEIKASYTDADKSANLVFELTGAATAVRLASAGDDTVTVTAVGNGQAVLAVKIDATDNYENDSVTIPVEALARPVEDISIGTTDINNHNLTGILDGSTIKVVGLGNPEDICVKLILATDVVSGLEQDPASDTLVSTGDKIAVKDGENLIAEYTVDLSGVEKLPDGTTVNETTKPATSAKPEFDSTAAALAPESDGLTIAAKDELVKAAEEAVIAAGEGATVEIKASLQVELQDMKDTAAEKVLTLEIKPVYVVETTKDGETTASAVVPITSALIVPVTIKVTLPAGFPTTNLYAKHYYADGVRVKEYIPVAVDGRNASWEQASFSKTEIVEDTRTVQVLFTNSEGYTFLWTFRPQDVGMTLPASGTATGGWTINGKTYTILTDELLTFLAANKNESGIYTVNKTDAPDPVEPSKPANPGNSNNSSNSSSSGGSSSSTPSNITFSASSNGAVTYTPANPAKGAVVTLTARPHSGYVLDTLRVLDSKGAELKLAKAGENKYTFIMPEGKVTVDAKFAEESAKAASFPFTDAADSWAKDAIAWAYENGYVNGTSATTFNPNGGITRQQMWMILARLSGASPADMTAARAWAMSSGVTDGTNPGKAMTRQQMVTFLYRYAQNRGYALDGGTSIDSFPDSHTVSNYALDPLAWAVGNGIVAGTADGLLNPGGGATRAQFAVILQRFYENTVEG